VKLEIEAFAGDEIEIRRFYRLDGIENRVLRYIMRYPGIGAECLQYNNMLD
jgi:hypothetical protein